MSWATPYVARLRAGDTVQFRPRGQSMRPRIESGDLCTVAPLAPTDTLAPGDVVLCRVRGAHYLHLVKAVEGARCLIGNNRGGVNGWIGRAGVYGRLVAVSRQSASSSSKEPAMYCREQSRFRPRQLG